MHFELSNFEIGVNENGYHFRDRNTGVIFTLLEAGYGKCKLAICHESAKEVVIAELKEVLRQELKKLFTSEEVEEALKTEIKLEDTYVSESSQFYLENFAFDSMGIVHEKSKKVFGILGSPYEVPKIGFFYRDWECVAEIITGEFWELVSPNVQFIKMEIGEQVAKIYRKEKIRTAKQKIVDAVVQTVEREVKNKDLYYVTMMNGDIKVNMDLDEYTFKKIQTGEYQIIYCGSDIAEMAAVAIRVFKSRGEIQKLIFKYLSFDKLKSVEITKDNIDKILRNLISVKKVLH